MNETEMTKKAIEKIRREKLFQITADHIEYRTQNVLTS